MWAVIWLRCIAQAAIEAAAFKQFEEQENSSLRDLKRKRLEESHQQLPQPQRRGTGVFRSTPDASVVSKARQDTKDLPCRDFNYRGCGRGNACKFGHFYAAAPGAAPSGMPGQQALAPAVSYATVAHSIPAGPQR